MTINLHYAQLLSKKDEGHKMTITHSYSHSGIALTDGIIEWGDGHVDTVTNASTPQLKQHTYSGAGSHTITIRPNSFDEPKLVYRYTTSGNDLYVYMNPFAVTLKSASGGSNHLYGPSHPYDKMSVTVGGDCIYPLALVSGEPFWLGTGQGSTTYYGVNSIAINEGVKTIYGSGDSNLANGYTIKMYGNYCPVEITLPSTLETIGDYAIGNFRALTDASYFRIHLAGTVPPTLSSTAAFYNQTSNSDLQFRVPKGSLATYKSAPYWSSYSSRILEEV